MGDINLQLDLAKDGGGSATGESGAEGDGALKRGAGSSEWRRQRRRPMVTVRAQGHGD